MAKTIPHGSSNDDSNITAIEKEISLSSEHLLGRFRTVYTEMGHLLSTDEVTIWAKELLHLINYSSSHSLEVLEEYLRVVPQILNIITFPQFLSWTRRGKVLCRDSYGLAVAYFRASPGALDVLTEGQIKVWLAMGPGLHKGNKQSIELACRFLDAIPALLKVINLAQIERLLLFLNRLAVTSPDMATVCLESAPQVFSALEEDERGLFLSIALTLSRLKPRASVTFFEKCGEALAEITRTQRMRFLSLLDKIAGHNSQLALSFLIDCSKTFGRVDKHLHYRLINQSETVLAISEISGIEFLKNCPAVLAEIGIDGQERWFREGLGILKKDEKEGLAFFRLEFQEDRTLERLLVKVELDAMRGMLLMYGEAIGGAEIEIRSSDSLAEWSMGAIHPGLPATDGMTIFLPSAIDRFDSAEENFTWYKVAVTHQAGHIEFGTFDFCFDKGAMIFPDLVQQSGIADSNGLSDMDRFIGLFDDRRLAADIFSLVEDIRIDYLVMSRYAGIRSGYRLVQQDTVWKRPSPDYLPLREAFLEIIIRFSLDGELPFVPVVLRSQCETALRLLQRLRSPQATVEDSAGATVQLYGIASAIPNTRLPEREWNTSDSGQARPNRIDTSYRSEGNEDVSVEPGTEVPYQAPTDVDYRGNSHPEMLKIKSMSREGTDQRKLAPLSPNIDEVQLNGMMEGQNLLSGQYTTDLPSETLQQETPSLEQDKNLSGNKNPVTEESLGKDGQSYIYKEWDFHLGYYRPDWCRVKERLLPDGNTDYYDEMLASNHMLSARVRKQFEMITPELLRKSDRLYDGEDLDLDALVRAVVERKAGSFSDERIYWKRRKVQRDVAAILLLDMSASTGKIIKDAEEGYPDWYLDTLEESRRLAVWHGEASTEKSKRVIDVVKESIVLMMDALDGTGDCYGVYGFSGHGRDNVEILVIKGIEESFSGLVKGRVDSITPLYGTRMGSAIRHATSKLDAHEAKTKLLFMVSDGYPQDEGYGHDNGDKEYALQDTRMAFIEAKKKNIMPFCLTVDMAGHDYLRRICDDINYEVVNDIESLPHRLPALYRKLTT